MSSVRIRPARPDEIQWINSRYDEVGFVHSDFDREFIAVAEIGDERVGLGRVVAVSPGVGELGGMFVDPAHRGKGVADAIVAYLLEQRGHETLFCIPFEKLAAFYGRFGFRERADIPVPEAIREKVSWCNCTYAERALLFARGPNGE